MNDLQKDKSMEIKKATLDDSKFVLKLFNDYDTRINSFNTKPIKEKEHSQWFKKALVDPDIEIYIAWIEEHRIGKCQIEHTPSGLMLSWVIPPEKRHQGYGKQMMKQIMKNRKGTFYAYIKKSNIASQKIAEALGMKKDGFKKDFILYKRTVEEY